MVSDSATAIPTQQSVKKYVDERSGAVGGGGAFRGYHADLTGYISVETTASFGEIRILFDSADTGLEGFRIGTSGQEILSIDTMSP